MRRPTIKTHPYKQTVQIASQIVETCSPLVQWSMNSDGEDRGAVRFTFDGERAYAFPLGINIGCRTYYDISDYLYGQVYAQEGCQMAPDVANQGQIWYNRDV